MQNLLGVVLSGGQSKRMGKDKGLLPINDTIRVKYVADKLSLFTIPVVFSINAMQVANYAACISSDKLIVDTIDVQGPLKGLLSVHAVFPENDLLLLACDMLDLDQATIQRMIGVYQTEPGYDCYVYQDTEYAQPFCGIYTSKRLKELLFKAKEHAVNQFSMQKILDESNTKRMLITHHTPFMNYNTSD
jgi:molybdopterin-guanine dinucleotide biosynthesis protein A